MGAALPSPAQDYYKDYYQKWYSKECHHEILYKYASPFGNTEV
jgi:hypothetical protein